MINRQVDKIIIFLLCLIIYFLQINNTYIIVPIILAVILFSFSELGNLLHLRKIVYVAYLILSLTYSEMLYFLPLFIYEYIFEVNKVYLLALILPLISFKNYNLYDIILVFALCVVAVISKYKYIKINKLKQNYVTLRDENVEVTRLLQQKNKKLIQEHDYQIYIAMLNERNRIARDIHDSVGHLLSSAILQIGALSIVTNDTTQQEKLKEVKNTLDTAMDSIRNSVHNIYENSIDLKLELEKIINEFRFCELEFSYNIKRETNNEIKFMFLNVVKESLTNISKHSMATKASVILREYPAIYQLVISDNGVGINKNNDSGIGLKNITERVKKLNGILNIQSKSGFRLFITIPKEKIDESSNN